jgi:hypothetical protein
LDASLQLEAQHDDDYPSDHPEQQESNSDSLAHSEELPAGTS